ncbi:NAD-dependent epimerase/dehydratase family protein [Blastococcus sp. SYSU DS0552]
MRVAITGADGFLAWHLRCALAAHAEHEVVPLGRPEMGDPRHLHELLATCDAVVHLAGVNRDTEERVAAGNRDLAQALADALPGTPVRQVVYGNSIHAGAPTAFGTSKAFASEELGRAAAAVGATFSDVVLPNLFGEGGRPHYNSVVATFCSELVAGRTPEVRDDKVIPLLHAQDAADALIDCLVADSSTVVRPQGQDMLVSDLLATLEDISDYARTGHFPDLSSPMKVALFTTFQSYCFPSRFPFASAVHSDDRGVLFETTRARRTDSLSFISTTVPGAVRGQHYHRRKVERFFVIEGDVEIRLRRMVTGEQVQFHVSGRQPQAVDMPTMWAHSLRNVGTGPAVTAFWSNELLDPENPDTYRFPVYET